jgi:uncharacterized protein
MSERPNFKDLQQALEKTDAEMLAAESHGSLCGICCAGGKPDLKNWLNQVFDELDLNNMLIKEASQLLVGLFNNTQQQLNDSDADFQMFLPDDDVLLAERTEALAQWCHGFSYGLVTGGLKEDTVLPEDTKELIQDLVEIARAGHDASVEDDNDEEAYMQLYEYVRMGVLLINEELQPIDAPKDTIH